MILIKYDLRFLILANTGLQRFGTCRGETMLKTPLAPLTKARQNMR